MAASKQQQTANQQWYATVNWFADVANNNPADLPDSLLKRLIQWRRRFDVYSAVSEHNPYSYNAFASWHSKKNLARQGNKLAEALLAHKEISEKKSALVEKNEATKEAIDKLTRLIVLIEEIIDLELTKVEITQLKMISKAQFLIGKHL